jgi:hypothetical protein
MMGKHKFQRKEVTLRTLTITFCNGIHTEDSHFTLELQKCSSLARVPEVMNQAAGGQAVSICLF